MTSGRKERIAPSISRVRASSCSESAPSGRPRKRGSNPSRRAARSGYGGEVCCYEVWTSLWPNAAVDISSVVDVKREAINCYASQVAYLHYVEGALGLNRFRGLKLEVPYAEAFFACEPGTFHELCRTLAVI